MELNAAPTPGMPAPYGRACSACARAKAKCVTGNAVGAKCERCFRLNKDCQPLQTVRKRKVASKLSNKKTERLEEKLDGIYKLLQSSASSTSQVDQDASASTELLSTQPSSAPSQSHVPSPQNNEDLNFCSILRLNGIRPSANGPRLHSPTTAPDAPYVLSGTRSTVSHCPDSSLISGLEPSPDQAEDCLDVFRRRMTAYFPFVIVSESTTAHELRRDRPFLWLCIMSAATKSTAQQKILGKEIRITMGREILVEGKNNIDLLLGLLVSVAWGHYHIYEKPIIIQTMQLATALVGNLGLNKPPLKEPPQMMLNLNARGCPTKPFTPSTRTLEERRAVLGCFLLSSVVSFYFQRLDALRWTPYLDECIAVLGGNKEQKSDALLVDLVKLQLIDEEVGRAPWHEGSNDASGSTRAPSTFYLKALQAQLRDFKTGIEPEVQNNDALLLHLYSTELRVHENALSKAPVVSNSPAFERLDSLFACLHATKSWFDLFLSLPPASCIGLSIPIFTQLAQCIIALFRLSTFDNATWDQALVRETADLTLILGQIVHKFTQVKFMAGLDHGALEDKDIFSETARTLEALRTWWDSRLATASTDNSVSNETLSRTYMDFSDDMWLKDIFSGSDGYFDLNMQ